MPLSKSLVQDPWRVNRLKVRHDCSWVSAFNRLAKEQPPRHENAVDEPDAGVNTDKENESDRGLATRSNASAREAQDEQDAPSDHAADHDRPSTPDDRHEEPGEEEEVSAVFPRKSRHRRVVSEPGDDDDNQSEGEPNVPPKSLVSVASPSKSGGQSSWPHLATDSCRSLH